MPRIFDNIENDQILLDELQKVFKKPAAQIFVLIISNVEEIDRVLAQHYCFTDEKLDFIINYDIKYRLDELGGDDGDWEDE